MKTKSILTILLSILTSLAYSQTETQTDAQSETQEEEEQPEVILDGILYRINPDSTATLTYIYPTADQLPNPLIIPSTITTNPQIPKSTNPQINYHLSSIGREAFRGSELISIRIPETIDSIAPRVFFGCTLLTTVNIPRTLTYLPDGLFWGCTSLPSVTIPETVTRIGNRTFKRCTSFTTITLPDSVIQIGDEAFYECVHLRTLTLGPNIQTIGRQAFYRLLELESLTILAPEPPTLTAGVLDRHLYSKPLYVPAQSLTKYQTHPLWKYMDIHPIQGE